METYTPTRVLITGGLGFIGSNLVNYLVEQYPQISFVNLDRGDYCASEKNITVARAPNYDLVKGSIGSSDLVHHLLTVHQIDTVINLAAQSSVDRSENDPAQHILDNVVAVQSFLETCHRYGKINRFIHVSTDEVYGDQADGAPVNEESIFMPNNVYSASKAAGEMIVRAYRISHGLPVIITRGNNVFGPRQYPEKVVPKFTMQLLKRERMTIHGAGDTKRNFLHVHDTVRAFETILFKGRVGEIYNIGTTNEFSVLEIAEALRSRICPELPFSEVISYVGNARRYNDQRYWISSEKLRALGWKETISFEEALSETVDWYREFGAEQWS